MLLDFLRTQRKEILEIAQRYGAYDVQVFGSVARGEDRPDSDVDFLVQFESGRSLLDEVGLVQDLEALLGRKVDLGDPETLHWYVKDKILKEAVPL